MIVRRRGHLLDVVFCGDMIGRGEPMWTIPFAGNSRSESQISSSK